MVNSLMGTQNKPHSNLRNLRLHETSGFGAGVAFAILNPGPDNNARSVLCFGTTDFQRLLSRPALIGFGPVGVGICFGLASARFAAAIINTPFT